MRSLVELSPLLVHSPALIAGAELNRSFKALSEWKHNLAELEHHRVGEKQRLERREEYQS